MAIPLSAATHHLLVALFHPTRAWQLAARLESECGERIPGCAQATPISLERIRFSIIRLVHQGDLTENAIFDLAKADWRDLLMAAGHGFSTSAHADWAERMLRQKRHRP